MEPHRDISARKYVLIFSAYFLLAAVYSWPLPIHLFDGITGACGGKVQFMCMGDQLQTYYHIGLLTEALHGHIKWFTNPLEYVSPDSPDRFFTYLLPVSLIYVPFTIVSKTFAYNCLTLICFALGGFFACLFTHELTKNITASFIGGFVFNFAFWRQMTIHDGQPGGFYLFLIPLILFCMERTFTRRSLADSAVAGAAIFSLAINIYDYIYYLFLFFMVYFPWRLISELAGVAKSGERAVAIKKMALAMIPLLIGMAVSVAWLLHIKNTMISHSQIGEGRSLVVVANASSELWGMISSHARQRGVYITLPVLIAVLAGIGLGVFSRGKNEPRKWDIVFFAAVFVVSYILAFGTTEEKPNPLYLFFYNHVPYFKMSRTPVKLMSVTLVSMSALTAYLFAWILRGGKWAYLLKPAGFSLFMAIAWYVYQEGTGISLLDNKNAVYTRATENLGGGGGG
jgi:hypothetical protein